MVLVRSGISNCEIHKLMEGAKVNRGQFLVVFVDLLLLKLTSFEIV